MGKHVCRGTRKWQCTIQCTFDHWIPSKRYLCTIVHLCIDFVISPLLLYVKKGFLVRKQMG